MFLFIRCSSPVSDHKLNAGFSRSLQGLVGLIYTPASTVLPIDLKNLVPKTQAGQGCRRVGLHQLEKHTLRDKSQSESQRGEDRCKYRRENKATKETKGKNTGKGS